MISAYLHARWTALAENAMERARLPHTEAAELAQFAAGMAREATPSTAPDERSLFCSLRWNAQTFGLAQTIRREALADGLLALAKEALALLARTPSPEPAPKRRKLEKSKPPPVLRRRADLDD